MGLIAKSISGFALKIIPDKVGIVKPEMSKASRNKTITKILEEDPLLNH